MLFFFRDWLSLMENFQKGPLLDKGEIVGWHLSKSLLALTAELLISHSHVAFLWVVFMSFNRWNAVFFWSAGTPWYLSVFFWQVWQRSVDGCIIFMTGRKSFLVCENFYVPQIYDYTTVYPLTVAACLFNLDSSALVVEVGRSLIKKLLYPRIPRNKRPPHWA